MVLIKLIDSRFFIRININTYDNIFLFTVPIVNLKILINT